MDQTLKKYINKIHLGNNLELFKNLPDNSIDLVVTSPPYDGLRDYNGFEFNLHETGKEIQRVLKLIVITLDHE